jgi:hypothetical protein
MVTFADVKTIEEEVVAAYFKMLPQHWPRGTVEIPRKA